MIFNQDISMKQHNICYASTKKYEDDDELEHGLEDEPGNELDNELEDELNNEPEDELDNGLEDELDNELDNEGELKNQNPPENYKPNKLLQNLKNPIFIKNSIDPITGKYVKSIYARKVSKMGREIWHQVWQYYRDRKRADVESCYKKYYHTQVRVIYSGDPRVYYYLNKQPIQKPDKPPKELEMSYKEKRGEHKEERKNLILLEREMKKVVQREEQKKHLELLKLQKEGKIILPPKIPKRNPDKYSKEGRERIKARLQLVKERKGFYKNDRDNYNRAMKDIPSLHDQENLQTSNQTDKQTSNQTDKQTNQSDRGILKFQSHISHNYNNYNNYNNYKKYDNIDGRGILKFQNQSNHHNQKDYNHTNNNIQNYNTQQDTNKNNKFNFSDYNEKQKLMSRLKNSSIDIECRTNGAIKRGNFNKSIEEATIMNDNTK